MAADSPDPMIVQLRGLIRHALDHHHRGFAQLREEAANLQIALDLCDALIERYPVLTTAADDRRWLDPYEGRDADRWPEITGA